MSSGGLVTADTIALWGFDEAAEVPLANYAAATDAGPNGLGFTDTNFEPLIIGALGGVTIDNAGVITDADYGRWFDGTNDRLLGTALIGATRSAEIVTGPVTVQAWIRMDEHVARRTVFSIAGTLESEATNHLLTLTVEAGGMLRVFWESGGGVNREALQTAGMTVPLDQWIHIAVVCTDSGGNRTVEFFIGGVSQDSDSDVSPSGGSSAVIGLGVHPQPQEEFEGRIGSIDIDLAALSPATLATAAAATDTRFTGATTNTWARFNFPEAPSVHDYGPNGMHLAPRVLSNAFHQYGTVGLPRNSSNGAHSAGGTNQGWFTPTTPALVAAMQDASEWTLLMWHCPDGDEVSGDFFGVGPPSGELEEDNFLAHFDLNFPGQLVDVGWEHGAGINDQASGASALYPLAEDRSALFYGFVKSSQGGGLSDVLLYKDGGLIETLAALTDPTGGDAFDSIVHVWASPNGIGSLNNALSGYVDRVHLVSQALTAPQILTLFETDTALGGATVSRRKPRIVRSSP